MPPPYILQLFSEYLGIPGQFFSHPFVLKFLDWPVVGLLLSFILLHRYPEAIGEMIRRYRNGVGDEENRMLKAATHATGVGPLPLRGQSTGAQLPGPQHNVEKNLHREIVINDLNIAETNFLLRLYAGYVEPLSYSFEANELRSRGIPYEIDRRKMRDFGLITFDKNGHTITEYGREIAKVIAVKKNNRGSSPDN